MTLHEISWRNLRWFGLTLALVVLAFACEGLEQRLRAQDSSRAKGDDRAGRHEEMSGLVRQCRAYRVEPGRRVPVELRPEPLQRWNDPTREFSDASLWVWGNTGRPIAALAVELYPADRTKGERWAHEFVWLTTEPIEVERGERIDDHLTTQSPRIEGTLRWAPKRPGIEFREIPGAPAPARAEVDRLRQFKALAPRFSAREFYDRTRQTYALRLLPHPVLRYADPERNLVDGALFLFAHGTNPEILLLIEAQGDEPGSATWRYGLAPLSRAELTVRLDQKDVWTRPIPPQLSTEDSYFTMHTVRTPPADDSASGTREKP
jgi:hypothetical protein